MTLSSDIYVPALRWRQGEYQALVRLSDRVKDRIVPLITIPDVEYDFEERRPKKSVQDHVQPFPARYKAKWGPRPAWIGINSKIADTSLADGRSIFTYVFSELRSFQATAIPAITLAAQMSIVRAVKAIIESDGQGVAISVRMEDLMRPNPGARVKAVLSALGASLPDTDLIVDLGAPNFEPYDAFAIALIAALGKLSDLNTFRNFVLIGTAIPATFRHIAKGGDEIPRDDWLFYHTLAARLPINIRRPHFGDYTIVHPEFTPQDMRLIKPSGKLVYTMPRSWFVHKGGAFRDNPKQMHDHCGALIRQGIFKGAHYSSGDDYIAKCAVHKVGPSNQTRWKDVAINHHITHVVDDLASLCAST